MGGNVTPMDKNELLELAVLVEGIRERDVHLGRVLRHMVVHLGHAYGLDLSSEEAQAKADKAKAQEAPVPAVKPAALSSDTDKRAVMAPQGDK
jgi:hypothetical protein